MKVLAIDGGGIRGLIPALVLAEIERRTRRPAGELFDLIAGTSTGGIIAAALARPDPLPAARIVELYEQEGPKIFHRSLLRRIETLDGNLLGPRYDDSGLDTALRAFLGDARLSQVRPDLLVTAYDIERRNAFFFRSARARTDPSYDFTLAAVARSTSAAPTYFAPALAKDVAGRESYALVDGGVFAVNPSMCAYADLARRGRVAEIAVLASLGTGSHTRPIRYADAKGWGRLQWASPVIDVVFDGVADTIEFETAQLLPPPRSLRFQTELREASDNLDDASASNLAALRREAERLLHERTADVDVLCAALTA